MAAITSDKGLRDLENRLRAGKVTQREALEIIIKLVPLLKRRTRMLQALATFADGVSDEDRLYVHAWKVWRRKAVVASVPQWIRSNEPEAFAPQKTESSAP